MFQRSVPAVLFIDFDNVEKYGSRTRFRIGPRGSRQSSGSDISKQTITRALERKFGSVAQSKWFGCGDYKSVIGKAEAIRSDLSVRPARGGGVSVRYKSSKKRPNA
jgi:hypothetical protein